MRHGSCYQSELVHRPAVDTIRTKLYRAILSVTTHNTRGHTNVPLVPIPYRTGMYRPYRAVHCCMVNVGMHYSLIVLKENEDSGDPPLMMKHLLKEFHDVVLEEIPHSLPLVRDI